MKKLKLSLLCAGMLAASVGSSSAMIAGVVLETTTKTTFLLTAALLRSVPVLKHINETALTMSAATASVSFTGGIIAGLLNSKKAKIIGNGTSIGGSALYSGTVYKILSSIKEDTQSWLKWEGQLPKSIPTAIVASSFAGFAGFQAGYWGTNSVRKLCSTSKKLCDDAKKIAGKTSNFSKKLLTTFGF